LTQVKRFGVEGLLDGFDLRPDANGLTIFLGGCHVGGAVVGEQNAFPALLQKATALLSNTDCMLVSGVSTRVGTRAIRDLISRGRVSRVILQLSHRETIRAARLSLLWRRRSTGSDDRPSSKVSEKISAGLYVRKVILGAVLQCLGFDRWAMSQAVFERRLVRDTDELLTTLKATGDVEVVLLSCFPTANKRLNDRRLVANRLMSIAAQRVGFTYLDVWSALSFRSGLMRNFARPSMLADSAHLNAKGHHVVAEAIDSVLPVQYARPQRFVPCRTDTADTRCSVPTSGGSG
jgi:hypothetical protein